MSSNEGKLKILHLFSSGKDKIAFVAIEQGKIGADKVFQSARTGTKYHITSGPVYIGNVEVLIDPLYPKLICDYLRAHKDYATNKQMQQICETKRGFSYSPILFAKIGIVPFDGVIDAWNYIDAPERFDAEVGDILEGIDE